MLWGPVRTVWLRRRVLNVNSDVDADGKAVACEMNCLFITDAKPRT